MQFFGRRKETEDDGTVTGPSAAALEAAYDRGRRDERSRRRGHPLLSLVVFTTALVGAGVIGLAATQGSFAGGGQVIDRQLSIASGQAQVASRDAVVATGEAMRDAEANLHAHTVDRIG